MESTANETIPTSLFTVLRYKQLDLDFGPEPITDVADSAQVDDDGHIPYDGDHDLEKFLHDQEAAIERTVAIVSGPTIDLCSIDGVQSLKSSVRSRPRNDDLAIRDRAILNKLLVQGGCFRPLRTLGQNWREDLDALERAYKNFSETIAYVRAMGALAELSDRVIVLDPILLDGEPGSGKSTIVEELSTIVAGGFRRIAMSAAETGAQIGGSAASWSNSTTGAVFDALVNGPWGNPMILLDELDRSSSDTRFPPVGPLFQLLEPAMSKAFQDLSVPSLSINASRILWMATSNDRSRIPEPLRQRLTQFNVPYPNGFESHSVVNSVMQRLALAEPVIGRFSMTPDAVAALAKHPPRVMRRLIRIACGNAAQHARFDVGPDDFPSIKTQKRGMGFFA